VSGKPRQAAVTPAEELRELTREAHAAVKDLRQAIREARSLADQVTLDMVELMAARANEEMDRTWRHIQKQANANSKSLHDAVTRARTHIIKALTPEVLEPLDNGTVRVQFEGGNFEPEPVPLGEEVNDGQQAQAAGPDPAAAVDADAAHRGHRP
jgi:hypothetical protein